MEEEDLIAVVRGERFVFVPRGQLFTAWSPFSRCAYYLGPGEKVPERLLEYGEFWEVESHKTQSRIRTRHASVREVPASKWLVHIFPDGRAHIRPGPFTMTLQEMREGRVVKTKDLRRCIDMLTGVNRRKRSEKRQLVNRKTSLKLVVSTLMQTVVGGGGTNAGIPARFFQG